MLSIIMPTRHRSLQAFNCVQRIIEVSDGLDYEIVISAHPEKETIDLFSSLNDSRVNIFYMEHNNGIEAWNFAASQAQGDALTVSDDDLWYHPDWWVEAMNIIDVSRPMYIGIGEFGHGQDSESWPERAIGTRKFFVNILGGVLCIPHYKSHHDDVEKSDKARANNVLLQVNGNIEHRHYTRCNTTKRDETNARAERWYGVDSQTYHSRKSAGFPIDYSPLFK